VTSIVQKLSKSGIAKTPKWMPANIQYETMMGSIAYGVSNDMSDVDIYGFAIPPKEIVFPHLRGEIFGFGTPGDRFEQYQEHHLKDPDGRQRDYDITIYSIIKYFQLLMGNNPNMIDSIFTPRRCVLHSTYVGELVRERRKIFLHKGGFHSFKGYAYAQMNAIDGRRNSSAHRESIEELRQFEEDHGIDHATSTWNDVVEALGDTDGAGKFSTLSAEELRQYAALYEKMMKVNKRLEGLKRWGFDVKFAYHVVRLLVQIEQVMIEGDLDLERNREQLKAIRRGEWTLEQLKDWHTQKEKSLEDLYTRSTLQHKPDEAVIKQLLVDCLEHHYGTLSKAELVIPTSTSNLISDLETVLGKYR